tara:strand:- start:1954 stop:2253 length:300 start_codon:yes stop_codon:yes gene_type:complete
MGQNERLLENMKKHDIRQKLPKWFNGEVYTDGATVQNRFSGEECELNNVELSMYDFIMGATMVYESAGFNANPKIVVQLRKGLDWFRKNNSKAYMVLLD